MWVSVLHRLTFEYFQAEIIGFLIKTENKSETYWKFCRVRCIWAMQWVVISNAILLLEFPKH